MPERRDSAIAAALIGLVGAIIAALITRGGGGGDADASGGTEPRIDVPIVDVGRTTARVFLNRDSGAGGTTVLVSGEGFEPGERVVLRFHTEQIGSTTASDAGSFANVAVTIPTSFGDFAPQQFEIIAEGDDSIRSARAPFQLTG